MDQDRLLVSPETAHHLWPRAPASGSENERWLPGARRPAAPRYLPVWCKTCFAGGTPGTESARPWNHAAFPLAARCGLVPLDIAGRLHSNGTVPGFKSADMNPPLPAPSKRTVLGGIAILALMLGGLFAWRHWRTPVSTAEVAAYLDRAVGGGRLRFSAVQIRILQRDEADLQMAVAAMARPLEPLYSKIDAADYLQRKFQLDPESNAEARRLLADQGLSQNPEFRVPGRSRPTLIV